MISFTFFFHIIFATAFGEWVEKNIFSIISLLVLAIGAIIWLIRLEGAVKQMMKKMDEQVVQKINELETVIEELAADFNAHTKDNNAHVNHLYMQSFKERLIKLESTVETGNQKLNDKLDKLTEKMYGR